MIKAIISDVDGVLVGKKMGFNFPQPNSAVLNRLQKIHMGGIPIILCTAKSLHAIMPVIHAASLDNAHISDGGALISNPLNPQVIAKHVLKTSIVQRIVSYALQYGMYIELHSQENYAIQKNQVGNMTTEHAAIMQQDPRIVTDLIAYSQHAEIIKIVVITKDTIAMPLITAVCKELGQDTSLVWTIHPSMLPAQFAIITACGVSKKSAAEKVIAALHISFEEVLGIGDTEGDWNFMQMCGYVGVVGQESKELVKLAMVKNEGKYVIEKSVEENGILAVFDYFLL